MNANVSERFAKSFSMGTCGSPALVPRIELKSDFHMKDRIVRTTKPRLELSVQSPSCRVHRTIAFATAILLTFVTSARGAGLLIYETGAPDLGSASAGRTAMAVPPQNSIHAENTAVSGRAGRQMNFPAPP